MEPITPEVPNKSVESYISERISIDFSCVRQPKSQSSKWVQNPPQRVVAAVAAAAAAAAATISPQHTLKRADLHPVHPIEIRPHASILVSDPPPAPVVALVQALIDQTLL